MKMPTNIWRKYRARIIALALAFLTIATVIASINISGTFKASALTVIPLDEPVIMCPAYSPGAYSTPQYGIFKGPSTSSGYNGTDLFGSRYVTGYTEV